MERLTCSIPSLFADHHVIAVRKVLLALPGVGSVVASSMYRDVTVDFDAEKTSADALRSAIEAAGYPIGVEPSFDDLVESKEDGSPWFTVQRRITVTNMTDRTMSGDFRKY
jgi:copper chaperone CopZ